MPTPAAQRLRFEITLDEARPAKRLLEPLVSPDASDTLQHLQNLGARAADALAQRLGAHGEVRITLIDDERMRSEHARVMNDDTTTDVLSFDNRDDPGTPPGDEPIDADVLVCVDEAARQAHARGHAPLHEALLYILHGALHCMGHDDTTPDADARMHALEDAVLLAIGVGPVYGRRASE
ncbi:MAG: rRNA maturation RNase YbeY [Phycisphaerales bacterium]|nr:MAG: rRNA maturation RNase YbeY [Phycisphaerales bacterium]